MVSVDLRQGPINRGSGHAGGPWTVQKPAGGNKPLGLQISHLEWQQARIHSNFAVWNETSLKDSRSSLPRLRHVD